MLALADDGRSEDVEGFGGFLIVQTAEELQLDYSAFAAVNSFEFLERVIDKKGFGTSS
jgi:hypothetical protein